MYRKFPSWTARGETLRRITVELAACDSIDKEEKQILKILRLARAQGGGHVVLTWPWFCTNIELCR